MKSKSSIDSSSFSVWAKVISVTELSMSAEPEEVAVDTPYKAVSTYSLLFVRSSKAEPRYELILEPDSYHLVKVILNSDHWVLASAIFGASIIWYIEYIVYPL